MFAGALGFEEWDLEVHFFKRLRCEYSLKWHFQHHQFQRRLLMLLRPIPPLAAVAIADAHIDTVCAVATVAPEVFFRSGWQAITDCYRTVLMKTHGYSPYFTHACVPSHWAGCSRVAAAANGSSFIVVIDDALADQALSIGNRVWGGSLGMVAGTGLAALLLMAIGLMSVSFSRRPHRTCIPSAAEDIEESSGLFDGPVIA